MNNYNKGSMCGSLLEHVNNLKVRIIFLITCLKYFDVQKHILKLNYLALVMTIKTIKIT